MLLALLLSGCLNQTQTIDSQKNLSQVSVQVQIIGKDNVVSFSKQISVQSGTNALTALKTISDLNIESKEYAGMGTFVTAINGVAGDSEYFWALYVNDKFADKAIDKYVLDADTKISWKLEKIDYGKLS